MVQRSGLPCQQISFITHLKQGMPVKRTALGSSIPVIGAKDLNWLKDLSAPYIYKNFDIDAHGTLGKEGTGQSSLNWPQIRFAQVLLTYAEAQNEVGGGPNAAAWKALDTIRTRSQLTTPAIGTFTQATFREAVWRERWHELCYEGITWFDMVRLRKVYNETTNGFDEFVGHINKSSNQLLQAKHLLFPLGVQEMLNNPNLKTQNPGYPQ